MVLQLQRQIAAAIRDGASLEEIEDRIIDRAPVEEELRSALWLYAEALTERRAEAMLFDTAPVPLLD